MLTTKQMKKEWKLTPKQFDIVLDIITTIEDYDVEINLKSIVDELDNMIDVEYSHLREGDFWHFNNIREVRSAEILLKKLQTIQRGAQ